MPGIVARDEGLDLAIRDLRAEATMKRLLGAIVLVVILGGMAEARPARRPEPKVTVAVQHVRVIRPVHPLHPRTKPNFIGWVVDGLGSLAWHYAKTHPEQAMAMLASL